jgi:hypothetical protein
LIDELKMLLSIEPDEYTLYGHFKDRVIKKAQKDLYQHTDIYFEYEEETEKKRVFAITFFIYENKKNQRAKTIEKPDEEIIKEPTKEDDNTNEAQRIHTKISKYVSLTKVKKWIKEVSIEQIENAIKYTINHLNAGNKVANIGGFLNTMVYTPNLYDKYEVKKSKVKKANLKQQEISEKIESKKGELEQLRKQYETMARELEKEYFDSTPNLAEIIVQKLQANQFYDHKLTVEQNLQRDSIRGLRSSILCQLFPEYNTLSMQYSKRADALKDELRSLGYRN